VSTSFVSAVALVAAYALSPVAGSAQPSTIARQPIAAPAAPLPQTPQADAKATVQAPVQPAETPAVQADPCCKLAALTPVELEILTPASTKTSAEGQEIRIRVAEPVKAGDRVVIPSGTEGLAQIIQVSRGKLGGKAGELVIGAPYLNLAGQRINLKRLRYGSASGKDRTQQAAIATAVVGLVGMFVSGGNVDIASGTRANAVITTDTLVPGQP
jgi:hypothetical protein